MYMIIPFGCYTRIINRWMIRRVQVMHNGQESHEEQKFELLKDESDVIATFNITEIREVQKMFEYWQDPYKAKVEPPPESLKMKVGDQVRKKKGSQWEGKIVGSYSAHLTPIGWVVQSNSHWGSCQIYPEEALELI